MAILKPTEEVVRIARCVGCGFVKEVVEQTETISLPICPYCNEKMNWDKRTERRVVIK